MDLFAIFGNAAQAAMSALPIIIGAFTLGLGAFLLVRGAYGLWRHSKRDHGNSMSMGEAIWSLIAGFVMVGLVAFAAAGAFTFTGGAPTAGAGGAVVFQ